MSLKTHDPEAMNCFHLAFDLRYLRFFCHHRLYSFILCPSNTQDVLHQQTYLLIHSDPLISELRKKHSKISDDDHFLSEAVELLKINGDNELLPDDY